MLLAREKLSLCIDKIKTATVIQKRHNKILNENTHHFIQQDVVNQTVDFCKQI